MFENVSIFTILAGRHWPALKELFTKYPAMAMALVMHCRAAVWLQTEPLEARVKQTVLSLDLLEMHRSQLLPQSKLALLHDTGLVTSTCKKTVTGMLWWRKEESWTTYEVPYEIALFVNEVTEGKGVHIRLKDRDAQENEMRQQA